MTTRFEADTAWLSGCTYVCECPEPVKKLEVVRGKVVATLESGMKFIVPVGKEPA